ncbi:MAG: hypothetical protein MUF82_08390 [Bacteroidetes bacterium]|nr:hypothetical protein [Bacteroidota bacterium]
MYERCLNEAERVLGAQRDSISPVKKLWEVVLRGGNSQGFEVPMLADFTALLEGDKRFDVLPAVDEDIQQDLFEGSDEEIGEMEKLGVSPEDRVRLHRPVARAEAEEEEEITSLRRVQSSRPAKRNTSPSSARAAKPARSTPKKKPKPAPRKPSKRRPARSGRGTTARRRTTARRGRKK